jgi:signal transduction histidine kinase
MRERAAMLGGTLVTSETAHGGFVVAAFLPRDGAITGDALSTDPSASPFTDVDRSGRTGDESR